MRARVTTSLSVTSQSVNHESSLLSSTSVAVDARRLDCFEMILRKLSIVLILIVLFSFAQAKDECPLQCDCSDDFSVVRCRGMEKFPVFGFASKVKTL